MNSFRLDSFWVVLVLNVVDSDFVVVIVFVLDRVVGRWDGGGDGCEGVGVGGAGIASSTELELAIFFQIFLFNGMLNGIEF